MAKTSPYEIIEFMMTTEKGTLLKELNQYAFKVSPRATKLQIASAVDIIIHESRLSDGSRKVVAISEVTGLEGQNVVMQDIFAFRQTGVNEHGTVTGAFRPTGAVPTFYEHLKSRGLRLDPAMFDPNVNREVHLEIVGRA